MSLAPVLLFGDADDRCLDLVAASLDHCGQSYTRLATTDALELRLSDAEVSWQWGDFAPLVAAASPGRLPMWPLRAIFVRSPMRQPLQSRDSKFWTAETVRRAAFYDAEEMALRGSFLHHAALCGVAVVNGFLGVEPLYSRPNQLLLAREAGLSVPGTLVTQRPESVVAFAQGGRELIYKSLTTSVEVRQLTQADLAPDRLAALNRAPVTFQELTGSRDVRVYFCLGQIIAAFGLTFGARVDGREQGIKKIEVFELSSDVESAILRFATLARLNYGAIDFRETDGTLVFLESNVWPVFSTYQLSSGVPISDRIASALTRVAAT